MESTALPPGCQWFRSKPKTAAIVAGEGRMSKRLLEPNTTLYPVPVVLITTGGEQVNVMTCNRVASCSAEPPRLCLSIRPGRFSHDLIRRSGEFVVNLPTLEQQTLVDYAGVVTGRKEDKFRVTGLALAPAATIKTPLLADCPVNVECTVESELSLDSHTLFVGRVQAVHVEESWLDQHGELDMARAQGVAYDAGVVRERPNYKFQVAVLRRKVQRQSLE